MSLAHRAAILRMMCSLSRLAQALLRGGRFDDEVLIQTTAFYAPLPSNRTSQSEIFRSQSGESFAPKGNLAPTQLQPKMYFMYHDRHLWSLRNVETGPAYGSAPDGST
jgi:hypothetical protein